MMFWWGPYGSGWGFVLMSVGMLLFWGLVILGVVVVVRYLAGGRHRSTDEVLAERFARGESDEPEYRSRKAALRGDPQQAGGIERR